MSWHRENIKKADIHRGNLILVNPSFPVSGELFHSTEQSDGWTWELESPFVSQPEHLMQKEAAKALRALLQAAAEETTEEVSARAFSDADNGSGTGRSKAPAGRIVGVSGFRTMEEQQKIWDDCLRENGPEYTKTFVAIPGHSEHQTGLAIDVALDQPEIDFICPQFPEEGICGTFRKLAASYGFIERYPAGKEAVTHIGAEPWHFRYVGTPHAALMQRMNMVLEEYVVWLRGFLWESNPYCMQEGMQSIRIGYLPFQESGEKKGGAQILSVNSLQACDRALLEISGDNAEGFIITEKYERQGL